MCTAIDYKNNGAYFGRNLDLEYHYNETITVTPRNFDYKFKAPLKSEEKFAVIGMATVVDKYPLYYDAMNEKGLAMAGLNFPGNSFYNEKSSELLNVSPFELIPFILTQCADTESAVKLLQRINIEDRKFSDKYPLTPLHWMIADKQSSITVEPLKDGIKIYKNDIGVLTNNPPFDFHVNNLCNYMHLSPKAAENNFDVQLTPYSKGLGAFGLPGDGSSASRFVRAAFFKQNAVCDGSKHSEINQFFHIMGTVKQLNGAVDVGNGQYHITIYTSCCDLNEGIYYYKTYENSCVNGVDMFSENLDETEIISYPILIEESFNIQNRK